MQFRARVHTTMSSSSSLLSPPSPPARSALYLSANPPGPPLSGVARSRSRKGDAGSRGDGRGRRAAPSCACRVSSAAGCGEPGGAGGGGSHARAVCRLRGRSRRCRECAARWCARQWRGPASAHSDGNSNRSSGGQHDSTGRRRQTDERALSAAYRWLAALHGLSERVLLSFCRNFVCQG